MNAIPDSLASWEVFCISENGFRIMSQRLGKDHRNWDCSISGWSGN